MCGDDGWGNTPFAGDCYKTVKRHNIQEERTLKKWLYQCSLPFASNVFLLQIFGTQDEPAVLTTWKIVVKYSAKIFSRDNIVVVEEFAEWCLHYHHDGVLTFASNPDWTKMKPQFG